MSSRNNQARGIAGSDAHIADTGGGDEDNDGSSRSRLTLPIDLPKMESLSSAIFKGEYGSMSNVTINAFTPTADNEGWFDEFGSGQKESEGIHSERRDHIDPAVEGSSMVVEKDSKSPGNYDRKTGNIVSMKILLRLLYLLPPSSLRSNDLFSSSPSQECSIRILPATTPRGEGEEATKRCGLLGLGKGYPLCCWVVAGEAHCPL
eukprot:jgi/Bigna1/83684/fgenesh1_pg.113_\